MNLKQFFALKQMLTLLLRLNVITETTYHNSRDVSAHLLMNQ